MSKPKTSIPTDDWNIIVRKIHQRECVPFLGAGVNLKCGDEDSLPLGGDVALRLLERMIKRTEQISDASYRINWKNLKQYREDARVAIKAIHQEFAGKEEKPDLEALTKRIDEAGVAGEAEQALVTLSSLAAEGKIPVDEKVIERLLKSVLQILPDEEAKLAHIIVDDSLDQFQDLTRVALQDLARVSLRYRRNKNLPDFVDELKDIIPDTKKNAPRLLRILANMPFRLIVTTNYDRLMERALELFKETAVIDPDKLSTSVKTDGTLLSQFIQESVSEDTYNLLSPDDTANPDQRIPASRWVNELNILIQQTSLHLIGDGKLMQDGLSAKASAALDKRPASLDEVRLNRKFLETAYSESLMPHDKAYEAIVQPINGFQGTEENRIRKVLSLHDGLVLYKLHGTFTDDVPVEETRPVITEEDYIEFLTYVGGQGENIDKQITATIKTSTLLFLGYSLEDWNFRALFKGLIEKIDLNYRPFSYAIQKDPSEFWVRFWEGNNRNVHIFNVDICEFTEELESRYGAYTQQLEQVEKDEQKVADLRAAQRKERRARSGRA